MNLPRQDRYKVITRVNWIATLVDAVLTIAKLSVGFLTRSPALIADGIHSLSDLATDLLVLVLGKLAEQGPDADHPYGHARYETLGTVILGTVLFMVGLGIGLENALAWYKGDSQTPSVLALIIVALSMVAKEVLFHFTMKYARLTRSNLLEANAWHSRSDSLSSGVVFIGIACHFAGFAFVEYLAALFVAALIGKMGVSLAWNGIQDLIDRGVSQDKKAKIIQTLKACSGITNVHRLRSRMMGSDIFVDAHIQVDPKISVSEAHQINDHACHALRKAHDDITDITLHIDFEDDDNTHPTTLEPKRDAVTALLASHDISHIQRVDLHYFKNKVSIDLFMDEKAALENNQPKLDALKSEHDWIAEIVIYRQSVSTQSG